MTAEVKPNDTTTTPAPKAPAKVAGTAAGHPGEKPKEPTTVLVNEKVGALKVTHR